MNRNNMNIDDTVKEGFIKPQIEFVMIANEDIIRTSPPEPTLPMLWE